MLSIPVSLSTISLQDFKEKQNTMDVICFCFSFSFLFYKVLCPKTAFEESTLKSQYMWLLSEQRKHRFLDAYIHSIRPAFHGIGPHIIGQACPGTAGFQIEGVAVKGTDNRVLRCAPALPERKSIVRTAIADSEKTFCSMGDADFLAPGQDRIRLVQRNLFLRFTQGVKNAVPADLLFK